MKKIFVVAVLAVASVSLPVQAGALADWWAGAKERHAAHHDAMKAKWEEHHAKVADAADGMKAKWHIGSCTRAEAGAGHLFDCSK